MWVNSGWGAPNSQALTMDNSATRNPKVPALKEAFERHSLGRALDEPEAKRIYGEQIETSIDC